MKSSVSIYLFDKHIADITTLAVEFNVDLEFIANSLESMKKLRDADLPRLLKKYDISKSKQIQLLNEVSKRDLKGALNE